MTWSTRKIPVGCSQCPTKVRWSSSPAIPLSSRSPICECSNENEFKKKKGGGGVFTIFPPPPAWKSSSIFSTVNIPPGSYFTAFLLGSSSSPQWLLLFLFLHLWSLTDSLRQHLLISQMLSAPKHNHCRRPLLVGTETQWWLRAVPKSLWIEQLQTSPQPPIDERAHVLKQ